MSLKNNKLTKALRTSRKLRFGGTATVVTCALVAVVIFFNVAVQALEYNWNLKLDLTRNRMYSISDQTISLLKGLTEDVHIYTLYKTGNENATVQEMLEKYGRYTDHIKVQNIDPVLNPKWTERFPSETTISQNSVIVASADDKKFRIISSYQFYETEVDQETLETTAITGYQGEMKVTNAIVYVTAENTPTIYYLTGHQELDRYRYATLQDSIEAENYAISSINLTTESELLKPHDVIVVAGAQRDLTDDERDNLKNFLYSGGYMVYMADSTAPQMPNFESILALFGIGLNHDLVVENATNNYYVYPTYAVPNIASHEITSALRLNNLFVVFPNSTSFQLPSLPKNNVTITSLLTSSDSAIGKTDPNSTSVEFEEGDVRGPLTLALALTHEDYSNANNNSKLVMFGSADFSTIGLAGNQDIYINAFKWMQDKSDTVSIRAKTMNTAYLQFRSYLQVYSWAAVVVIGIPVTVLVAGIVVAMRRRNR